MLPKCNESCRQPQVALLPREVFESVASLAELRDHYTQAGATFRSTSDMIEQVRSDYALHISVLWRDACEKQKQEVHGPFVERVTIGGIDHVVAGITHASLLRDNREYHQKIEAQLGERPFWITEHNLSTLFIGRNIIEIADHHSEGILKRVWSDFLGPALNGLRNKLPSFSKRYVDRPCLPMLQPELSTLTNIELVRVTTHLPSGALRALLGELPPRIDLMWREAEGIPYTRSQKRSAFLATLMQAWNPQQWDFITDEMKKGSPFSEQSWGQKGLFVGKNHQADIKYFLEHGIADKGIVERAVQHAEVLNRSPRAYQWLFVRQELQFYGACFLTSIAGAYLVSNVLSSGLSWLLR